MPRTMRSRVTARVLAAMVALVALAGCGGDSGNGDSAAAPSPAEALQELTLTSDAFSDGEAIPERYTCDGEDVSPPLAWETIPEDAAELALVVTDPDAPDGPFVHWVVVGLDPASDGLAEGTIPDRAAHGTNDFGDRGYGGPCPPSGDPAHQYVFTLYAAKEPLPVDGGATADEVQAALDGRVLARGSLTGTYSR